jgi:endonuclease/exonuclease/phosphatase family metal-dependent hydrolase
VIRDANPDVLGLQEALIDQIDYLSDQLKGYSIVGTGRDDGKKAGEFSCILFRTDRFDAGEQGTLWLSDTPERAGSKSWGNTLPRIVTWARLSEKTGGGTVLVFNTHLDHLSQPSRERSAGFIMGEIGRRARAGEPVVLMGDFNAGETNPAVRRVKGQIGPDDGNEEGSKPGPQREEAGKPVEAGRPAKEVSLVDTFRVVHPDEAAAGTFHGFKGTGDGEKIDYIFVSQEVTVVGAKIVRTRREGRYPSDHFPVTARVVVTTGGGEGAKKGVPSDGPGR